jgi:hypothetical protein
METQMRMQSAHDIALTRKRQHQIKVTRFRILAKRDRVEPNFTKTEPISKSKVFEELRAGIAAIGRHRKGSHALRTYKVEPSTLPEDDTPRAPKTRFRRSDNRLTARVR